jgi:hypothetical protein
VTREVDSGEGKNERKEQSIVRSNSLKEHGFKEMKFGRVDILWLKANFRVLRAESGSELASVCLSLKICAEAIGVSEKPNADATRVSNGY